MKRIFVTLSAIALVAVAAQANAQGMYGGLKAGANFASMSNVDNSSTHTGFMGGLFVGKDVNEKMGFRVEGLWNQKGVKADQTVDLGSGPETIKVTTKLDYIEFPILFVYNLSNTEKMGFNLFAGPTLGFNIKAKAEADGGSSTDIKDNIESFEFGGAIGAGVAKKMAGGKAITLDARYAMGGTGVGKDLPSGVDNPKNRGVGVMLGYQMPLGSSK